jgi:hypothetical protein
MAVACLGHNEASYKQDDWPRRVPILHNQNGWSATTDRFGEDRFLNSAGILQRFFTGLQVNGLQASKVSINFPPQMEEQI